MYRASSNPRDCCGLLDHMLTDHATLLRLRSRLGFKAELTVELHLELRRARGQFPEDGPETAPFIQAATVQRALASS
jgi:hypothetical protein